MPVVAFVSQTAYAGGGVEHWLCTLASGLARSGVRTVVGLLEGPRFHKPARFLATHRIETETRVLRSDSLLREDRVAVLGKFLADYDDVVVVPVACADAADAAGIAKSGRDDVRLIGCLHGQTGVALQELLRIAPYADLMVSVSRRGARVLADTIGAPSGGVRHVPYGVEPPCAVVEAHRSVRELRVLYVGRLEQQEKRVLDLIGIVRATSGLPVRIEVAGDGPERAALESGLSGEIATGRVTMRGFVEQRRLLDEVYPRSDALLVLSPSEGGPITAWEAMIRGVVPVTSDFVGRDEEQIWKPESNSLVFPVGDVEAAARQLVRLLDPGTWSRLSASARVLPPAYLREGFISTWKQLVTEVAAAPARGAGALRSVPASPGRLARYRSLRRALHSIRRGLGWQPPSADAGTEWPGAYPIDQRSSESARGGS